MTLDARRRPPVRSRNRSSSSPAISAGTHADDPCCGELDRQRDRVEPSTDLHDPLRVRRVELQARPGCLGAIHERAAPPHTPRSPRGSTPTRRPATARPTAARPARRAAPGSSPTPALRARRAGSPPPSRPPRPADARSCPARSTPACPRSSRTRSRPTTAPAVTAPPARPTTTCASSSASLVAASSHNHAPTANCGRTLRQRRWSASRVFARHHPTPVNVTSRDSVSAFAISTSSSRPTNDVNCTGRFPLNASSDCNRGKSCVSSGCTTWNTTSGGSDHADAARRDRSGSNPPAARRPPAPGRTRTQHLAAGKSADS